MSNTHPINGWLLIEQSSHGFTAGQPLASVGGALALAQASTASLACIFGVVAEVINAGSFWLAVEGQNCVISTPTPGPDTAPITKLYLSPTIAGTYVNTAPVSPQISVLVLSISTVVTPGQSKATVISKCGQRDLPDGVMAGDTTSILAAAATDATTKANAAQAAAVQRANHTGTQAPSTILTDASNRFVTDTEKSTWNTKLNALEAGDAKTYGFLPSATAAANTTALQAAVNASATVGPIYVNTPGIYSIGFPGIAIPSKCSLIFGPGVELRPENTVKHVFYPANMGSRTITSDVILQGNGTVISNADRGGTDLGMPSSILLGTNGIIQLGYVQNWHVSGFKQLDGGNAQYFIQLVEASYCTVQNCYYSGLKDMLQVQTGHDITFINLSGKSHDDLFALNAAEYPENSPTVGDIENVTFINCFWDFWTTSNLGCFCRVLGGSWTDWTVREYKKGNFCHNGGRIYQKASAGAQNSLAGNAPTHTSGEATGADGITWRYKKDGTFYSANVRNITFLNCRERNAGGFLLLRSDNESYSQGVLPGTEGVARLENILVENCLWEPSGLPSNNNAFITGSDMTVKNVIVRNSKIVGTGKYGLIYLGIKAVFDNVVFENCIGNFVNCERFVLLGDSANPTPLSRLVFRGGEWEGNTANPHGNNAGIWVQTANEIGDLVFEDTHFKNFHNILNLSGGATTRLHLIRSKFTGCTKIVNNFGQNSPLTVYRQGTTIDIDDGSLFYSLYHNSTSIITFVSGENPVVYQANGTGTVYTFQSYVQAVTFGTTSPSVTVARRGTYRARARLLVKFNGATFTSAQTLRVRYRYGGSYATFQTVITLPIMTALTDTRIIEMPEYLYSWTAPGTEVVTLHADMSASPSAGTVTCEECEITLIPLTQI